MASTCCSRWRGLDSLHCSRGLQLGLASRRHQSPGPRCRPHATARSSSLASALAAGSPSTVRRSGAFQSRRCPGRPLHGHAIRDLAASGATSSRDRIAEVEEELRRLRQEVEDEQSATGGGPSGSGARAGDAPVVQPEVMDISQVADGAGRQDGGDASSKLD